MRSYLLQYEFRNLIFATASSSSCLLAGLASRDFSSVLLILFRLGIALNLESAVVGCSLASPPVQHDYILHDQPQLLLACSLNFLLFDSHNFSSQLLF